MGTCLNGSQGGLTMFNSSWKMAPADPASKKLLYLAAAFNLLAGLLVLLFVHQAPALVGLQISDASQLMYVDLVAWLVTCFGLGYALGGYDLQRFWPFIAMGALGKLGVVALVIGYFACGHAGLLVALLSLGDLLFAILFVRLLRAHAVS